MDTEKCRALFEILEKGSFSAAAENMGYTPSGLSRMMASFEKETGFPLLIRGNHGISATKECDKLMPVFREFLRIDERFKQETAEISGVHTGTVIVGTAYSIYYKWISKLIASFSKAYPGIEVKISEGKSTELCRMISDGKMDFCIMSKREGNISWHHLFDDPLVAVVAADSHLARADSFPLAAFESEPYIETFRGQDTDNARMFRKNKITPNVQFRTEDTYASYSMVESGLGVSLSNYLETKERHLDKNVKLMKLFPPQMVEIGIATPRDEVISPAAKKFKEFAMKKGQSYTL